MQGMKNKLSRALKRYHYTKHTHVGCIALTFSFQTESQERKRLQTLVSEKTAEMSHVVNNVL